jgi:sporulation protein YlmC with PRC-barrel domain
MKRNSILVMIISLLALVSGTAMADNAVPAAVRASSMIGAKAIDPNGQALGTIADLVIAEDNRSSYILVAKADDSEFVALSYTAASPKVNPDSNVVLSVAKKDFERAPRFAGKKVSDLPRPDRASAWQPSDFNQVAGISTLNPYTH